MRRYDVVVVGAGPAGSACARACAEEGLSTCLIEEHGTIGYPVQCAGLLSVRALAECRVSKRPVENTVSGAKVISSAGAELSFDSGETKAYVVDRGMLDLEMATAAADAGAEVLVRTAYAGRSGSSIITRGPSGRREILFRILVAADGPRSTIARDLGMERARVFLAGIQCEICTEMDPRFVELYPDASPDFFGWIIPLGKGKARAGLCGLRDVKSRFSSFLPKAGRGCLHLVTGTIPLGVMPRTYGHQTLFIGDAAGFAKPTSGGGVYTGVRSAIHAAAAARVACETGDLSDSCLQGYERAWKNDFGKELALGFRLFSARRAFGPAETERLIRFLSRDEVKKEIIAYGDMDRPGHLFRRLLKNPEFYPLLWQLLRSELHNIIK
jgi:digeranylgeranylglycerophospholipid reductase